MGNLSLNTTGYMKLTDAVRVWFSKNTTNVDSDLDDVISDFLDGFRKFHRYDTTSELNDYAKRFKNCNSITDIKKLL